jgi:hypothetical protein
LPDDEKGGEVVPITDSVPKKRRPKRTDVKPSEAQHAMIVASAYEMRCKGEDYVTIAKALKIKGGWIEAHRLVAEHYGELVAGIDKAKLREQEAGRLMALRAAIEPDVRRGDKWAIQADLKMSEQIADLMGINDSMPAGSGGQTAVQINIAPPWGNEPPPLPPADIEYE